MKAGKDEEARQVFKESVDRFERSPRHYQKRQKDWAAIARSHLQ